VLYPNDNVSQGKELRLKQEYFFSAASIADIIRRFRLNNPDLHKLHEKVCIHLNDTHPTMAIVELMRVLIDQEGFRWEDAWGVTTKTFAYTNHTLMPEALECWNVELLGLVLPRHLEIIYEINRRFLESVAKKFPGDVDRLRRMSIVQEDGPKRVRMAHLAIVGGFSINGVSALHTELLKSQLFKDFFEMVPEKFNNKTNGITPRRWLLKANPKLSELITETIGDKWVTNLDLLEKLAEHKENKEFRRRWRAIKQANKVTLAEHILRTMDIQVDPNSLFDVQVKRIHEYKRQFLFGLYIASQYLKIKNDPHQFIQPRTFMVGGKAAPGYAIAKLIIKFLTSVGELIEADPTVRDKIHLVFLENYRVSLAEKIIPAAELSEQISTAGMEASGTGNMKFMLNGALTIGTYDGANIEMSQQLGGNDIFIFGLKEREVLQLRAKGYDPRQYIRTSAMLREIFRLFENNTFSKGQPGLFAPLLDTIFRGDQFMVCADFEAYCRAQEEVSRAYIDQDDWTKKSIINVSKAGFFSSDRAIREYARDIWKV
jgi:starch phosphorylase